MEGGPHIVPSYAHTTYNTIVYIEIIRIRFRGVTIQVYTCAWSQTAEPHAASLLVTILAESVSVLRSLVCKVQSLNGQTDHLLWQYAHHRVHGTTWIYHTTGDLPWLIAGAGPYLSFSWRAFPGNDVWPSIYTAYSDWGIYLLAWAGVHSTTDPSSHCIRRNFHSIVLHQRSIIGSPTLSWKPQ